MEAQRFVGEQEKLKTFCCRVPLGRVRTTIRAVFFPRSETEVQAFFGYDPIFPKGGTWDNFWSNFNWFDDVVVTLAIAVNIVVLALYDPLLPTATGWNRTLDYIDESITYLFILELLLRWVAFGTRNYFVDVWRVLDFFVVLVSLVSLSFNYAPNVDAGFAKGVVLLRSARMLRPFKTMTRFPSVKILAVSLIQSFKGLLDITVLFAMFLVIFGVSATSQYKGRLLGRCVNDDWNDPAIRVPMMHINNFTVADFICGGPYEANVSYPTSIGCSPDQICDLEASSAVLLHGYRCPFHYTCLNLHSNPVHGFVSFDNTAYSMFTLFVMVTLEGWADVMVNLCDGVGIIGAFFCVVVILLGSLFILRLAIVLITVAFQKAKEEEEERQKNLEAKVVAPRQRSATMVNVQNQFRKIISAIDIATLDDVSSAPQTCGERVRFTFLVVRSWISVNILQKRRFTLTVPLIIIFNILIMMADHYEQTAGLTRVQDISNLFFSSVYTAELVLRVLGTEPSIFWKDFLNVLDVFIVVIGWCDIGLESFHVPFVRSLRALRVGKLLQSLPSVYLWITIIIKCLYNSIALLFLIAIFVFIFACMGMQFFGGAFCNLTDAPYYRHCAGIPDANFDTFGSAMMTCFQILTADGWNTIAYDAMRSRGTGFVIFFLVLFYIGNNVLVNILIGILLTARSTIAERESEELLEIMDTSVLRVPLLPPATQCGDTRELEMSLLSPQTSGLTVKNASLTSSLLAAHPPGYFNPYYMNAASINDVVMFDETLLTATSAGDETLGEFGTTSGATTAQLSDEALLPQHPLRRKVRGIVVSRPFEIGISLLIVASCVTMALKNPIAAPNERPAVILRALDLTFTALFSVEWFVCSIAFGFGFSKSAYLRRSKWNAFDALVLVIMIFGDIAAYFKLNRTLRTIATLRALRPLRFVKRSPTLKVVVNSLLRSLIPVKNILIVATLLFTVWGIMGVALFKGAFYSCTDDQFSTKQACESAGHRWVNAQNHFDHIFAAFASLFLLTTLDNWPPLMYTGINSVGPGVAPERDHRPAAAIYFLLFVVLSGFFIVNLFTSVLIDTYEMQRKRNGGASYMTPEQNAWAEAHAFIVRAIPKLPPASRPNALGRLRSASWKVVMSPLFDNFVHMCICINMLTLSMDHYPAPVGTEAALQYINYFFVALFTFEALLKIHAFRGDYFRSRWNIWDFCVVLVSIGGIVVEAIFDFKTVTSAFRAVRVLRLLRAVRSLDKIRKIMNSFLLSLVPLGNVTAVTFLIFFMFGVWGMSLFGTVKRTGPLNKYMGFDNIASAVLTLFRISTGDDTSLIIAAYKIDPPDCDPNIGECGEPILSQIFFNVFALIGMFVLLNMFTAVIVESFHSLDVGGFMKFSREHAETFVRVWQRFDPLWTMRVRTSRVLQLLNMMPISNPLSLRYHLGNIFLPADKRYGELRFLKALGVKETADGHVLLKNLIMCLCQAAYSKAAPAAVIRKVQQRLEKRLRRFPHEDATQPAYVRAAVHKIEKCWLAKKDWMRLKQLQGRAPMRHVLTDAEIDQLKKMGLFQML